MVDDTIYCVELAEFLRGCLPSHSNYPFHGRLFWLLVQHGFAEGSSIYREETGCHASNKLFLEVIGGVMARKRIKEPHN